MGKRYVGAYELKLQGVVYAKKTRPRSFQGRASFKVKQYVAGAAVPPAVEQAPTLG